MAKKSKYVEVRLFKHNIVWWLCIGFWWRPCLIMFCIFLNIFLNMGFKFVRG